VSIRRTATPADHFTIIPNAWVRDERLSWKARGLLAYLMSHAEGWSTSITSLVALAPEGKDAVLTGIRELESAGYLRRSRLRDSRGRLGEADYDLIDPSAPMADYPSQGNPPQDNPPPYKKNSSTEEQEPENEQQQRRGRATEKQIEFIRDLYVNRGGWVSAEREAEWLQLSIAEADTLINEYKSEPPWRRRQAGGF
jgi:hypothetical protein